MLRRFRDGHSEIWWAAELTLAGYGPDQPTLLVVATSGPAALPEVSTWYLATNLPRPGSPPAAEEALASKQKLEEVAAQKAAMPAQGKRGIKARSMWRAVEQAAAAGNAIARLVQSGTPDSLLRNLAHWFQAGAGLTG